MASSCTAPQEAHPEVLVELPRVVVVELCFSDLLQGLYYFFVCVLDLAQTHWLGVEGAKVFCTLPTCMPAGELWSVGQAFW